MARLNTNGKNIMSTRNDWRRDRQQEAVERQKEYDALSSTQKLTRAKSRFGNSKKEIDRLSAQLPKE